MSKTTFRVAAAVTAFIVGVFTTAVFAVIWPFALAAFVCNEIDSKGEA